MKRKEELYSLFVYAIMLVVAIVVAVIVILPMFKVEGINLFNRSSIVFGIIGVLASLLLSAILLELGHIAGAKIGKYDIVSVSILGLTFTKVNGKRKVSFKGFDGLTGETLVKPRYENGECISRPKAMLFLGNLFLAVLIVGWYLLFGLFRSNGQPTHIMSPTGLIGLLVTAFILFYNILPIPLDNKNDGYQFKVLGNEANIKAYNELLRVKACEVMNEDPGETKVFDEITNYTAEINMVSYYNELEKGNYDAALGILNLILKGGKETLSDSIQLTILTHKLYILLITRDMKNAKLLYEEELTSDDRRAISNSGTMVCIRTYILISSLLDLSESEVQYATSRADKAYKRVEPLRKDIEKELYKKAINLCKEVHPNWEPIVKDEPKKVEKKETVKQDSSNDEDDDD